MLFVVVRSVPRKQLCSGPCRILGLVSRIGTNGNPLHMPQHKNSVLVRTYESTFTYGDVCLRQTRLYSFSPFGLVAPSS